MISAVGTICHSLISRQRYGGCRICLAVDSIYHPEME